MSRSLKKGPFCDDHLMKKVDELNKAGKKTSYQNLVTSFNYIPSVCGTYICRLQR